MRKRITFHVNAQRGIWNGGREMGMDAAMNEWNGMVLKDSRIMVGNTGGDGNVPPPLSIFAPWGSQNSPKAFCPFWEEMKGMEGG